MRGFKIWVPTDLRYAANPLRVTLRLADVEFFGVAKACWHTLEPEPQNAPLFLFPWRSRNPGLVWKAHRVILGDRRTQQLWQEHFNKCLGKFGFAACTADTTLTFHRESEVRISTHVDDVCATGPQPALTAGC